MSASLEASLRLDIAQYQEQLAKARGEAKKFREQIKSDSGKSGGISSILGGAGNALSGLLPAASVAAVVGGTRAILSEMDDLADASLRLGESTETLQRVQYASQILAGVDLDGVTGSFLKLEKALGDVENAAASQALERYGVSAESLTRLPLDEKMIVLAGAFQKARADGTGYNDLLALLGKSAGDLIPMLEQSEEALRNTFGEAIVVPEAAVQRMAAINDQVDSFIAKQKSGITEFIGVGLMALDEILDPNKKQGDNFRAAGAGADKAVADAQKTRDDKADKLAEAAATAKATAALEAQAKVKKELDNLQSKESALSEKRMQDYLSILPPNLKLLELKRMIMNLEEQRAALAGPGADLESKRIQIETDLLGLKKQSRDADQAVADAKAEAADKAAKEAKENAEKAADQKKTLDLFNREMEIINAKIDGNKKLTEDLERRAEIQDTMNRLMQDAGLSAGEAERKATEMVDAKKNLEDKDKKDPTIKGYSREKMGGADEARARAEERVASSRAKRDGTVDKAFGSLGGADPAANPLAAQAGKNAASESASPTDPNAQAGQQVIALITQILSAVA